MKNSDLNISIEHKKMLKSRNVGKIDEFDTKINKMTHLNFQNKELYVNKTFFNASNEFDNFAFETKKIQNNLHKKTFSNNLMKGMRFSPPKKVNIKESSAFNKSIVQNCELLKNAKNILKNNKSLNHIIKKVQARSNNVSPINTSFNKKQNKKTEYRPQIKKKEILETDKDGI